MRGAPRLETRVHLHRVAEMQLARGLRFACAIAAFVVLQASSSGSEDETLSVCELKAQGPELNGQYVRVKAEFVTDLNHFAFFRDPTCPHAIISEDDPPLSMQDQSIRKFDRALWHHAPFASLKFRVEVSGKFEWQKNWQPPLNLSAVVKPGPRGILTIERVWDFKRIPATSN